MSDSGRRQKREPLELPRYDPAKAAKTAVELLREADVPCALVGRVAVWTYVPPDGQQYTKDLDLAVPSGTVDRLKAAAKKRGYAVTDLGIGGIGVRTPAGPIDFIDRHPYLSALFSEAVRAAEESGTSVSAGETALPVAPLPHLVAMKMVSGEASDDRDVEELLMTVPSDGYRDIRELVLRHLGVASAERLDVIARRVGHPGPGMKRRYKSSDDSSADGERGRKDPEEHA